MQGVESATWALVVVTSALFIATVGYVITAILTYKASKKHPEAMTRQVQVLEKQVAAQKQQAQALKDVTDRLNALWGILGKIEISVKALRF